MLQFSSYPACCTMAVLTGLGPSNGAIDKTALTNMLKAASKMEKKTDFSLISAVTTRIQATGAEFLKTIGFKECMSNDKSEAGQRHKETGGITLWCIEPKDWVAWQQKYIEENRPKKELQLGRLQLQARQDRYPPFTFERLLEVTAPMQVGAAQAAWRHRLPSGQDFILHRSSVNGTVNVAATVNLPQLSLILTENFGYAPTSYMEEGQNITWGRLREMLTDWRNGFIA